MLAIPALGHAGASAASTLPFKATLSAPTHKPLALQRWPYVIRVTDPAGRPIRARAVLRIVFTGETPPPPRLLGWVTFRGRYTDVYRWPRLLRGELLVFQATVTALGAKRTLRYAVFVR